MHDRVSRDVYGEPPPRSAPRRPGKLRIGYLSGDFRNHVMGKMMWQALRHHDGERFETFGYSATDARDAWTERIAASFTHFESLGALSDRDAVHRIAGADLDVLVDLSTHTKGARPAILAAKPARVQITHIASAGTAAMSAIDFKLTDRYADRDDAEPAIEARLVMAGCVYPYRHIEPAERYAAERASLGLAPDAVVIGAFCTPLKLSRRCMTLWRDVLAGIPHAVLAFSPLNPGYRDAYVRIAAAAGVGAARLVFLPQGRDDGENQARYRAIDFVLDPLPYGGVNGTLEALDMGVPVVTLVGARHGERSSYSILANLGVEDTVARTGREYVDLAVRLATDRPFASAVRAKIVAGLAHSALTDMPAHTRNLESAYVTALALRGEAPVPRAQ
jgi:predicted O-linked N-acetylglucosamine transferase (SPINDLY family)